MPFTMSLALALSIVLTINPGSIAFADVPSASPDDMAKARHAYDLGAEAFAHKSYAEAAKQFALADEIGPNPVALESSLRAAILADDAVLAMILAERAEMRPKSAAVEAQAKKAREQFGMRTGRISVTCAPTTTCTAAMVVDTAHPDQVVALTIGKRFWLLAGERHFAVTAGGSTTQLALSIPPGGVIDWQAPAPSSPPQTLPTAGRAEPANVGAPATSPPPKPLLQPSASASASTLPPKPQDAPARHGISRNWVWAGVGTSAAFTIATVGFAEEAVSVHDRFEKGEPGVASTGKTYQALTNTFIALGSAASVATVVFAITADWSQAPKASPVRGPAARASFGPGTVFFTVDY